MNKLFSSIRWRLVAWAMLTLGLTLIVLGATIYVALSRGLTDEVDRNLLARSDQAPPILFGPPGGDRGRGRPGGIEGYRGGTFFLGLRSDGAVFVNPQQVDVEGVTFTLPEGRAPVWQTLTIDGEPTRVILRRVPDGQVVVVGQSLAPEEAALRSLLLVLLGGAALGLLLSFAGAWFLSGRALVPIQQAFRRQQEFIADASHELRTPLTVLRSATDLLAQRRDQPLDANGELFDDTRAEIARMERIAADLLTLARSDQGELELMVAPMDLRDVAADVVRRATPLAHTGGVQLELAAAPETVVEADPDRVMQALFILVDNAIKYTPAGGTVSVQVVHEPTCGLLRVTDTGPGIAAEHLPRIFDRFYRVDTARSRDRGGTGLGLAIAKMLIDAHGGELSLTSAPGSGTQATIRLPLVDRPASIGGRLTELAAQIAHAGHHN